MILGRINQKLSTTSFAFTGEAKKFEYVQAMHSNGQYVLAYVVDVLRENDKLTGMCEIIGFLENGRLQRLRTPLDSGSDVLLADDEFVKKVLQVEERAGAFIGTLDGRNNIRILLDINKLITGHMAIIAKSGSGKSFCCGVILEELMEHNVPLVVIDPHGEYNTLKYPGLKMKDELLKVGLEPKGYLKKVVEYSPDIESNSEARPLRLSNKNITPAELVNLLPAKLSNSQVGLIYSALKNLGNTTNFDELVFELQAGEENPSKWTLINILLYIKKLNLFSENATLMSELVSSGKCSIINLKGVPPEMQEVVAYKIIHDLFTERKKGNIPPFFLIVEEAQNFCPERSFGEKKSSAILRQVASEGRKFGLGLAVISQRPARLDKSVISQCRTHILLRLSNPNDLRAVSTSVEGLTTETDKEIQHLPIGTALITGVVDTPLFVNIRPRRTRHGGEAVDILSASTIVEETSDLLPLIKQRISAEDLKLMSEDILEVKQVLFPCAQFSCSLQNEEFFLVVDLVNGTLLPDIEKEGLPFLTLPLKELSSQQQKVFLLALKMKEFKPAELFSVSGLQFSELYDLVSILTKKGYLSKNGEKFAVVDKLKYLASLKNAACYEKVDYMKADLKQAFPAKFSVDLAREVAAKFAEIKVVKECYLVRYEVVKRASS